MPRVLPSASTTTPRPKTWSERWRRWWRPPRRLTFTREGKYFVGITFGVGVAAINTGNNLLYLLLGMMLSMIVASGILSELSLRDLTVSRQPPGRLHARQPFLMGIALLNTKRRLPSFSIEVEDLLDGKPVDKKCYFLKLPAGRQQATSYRHTLPRRGRYRLTGFILSTKFPFALFRKSRTVELSSEVIVFPALVSAARLGAARTNAVGTEPSGKRARRGEPFGLHAFREGDDPRDIHWPTTARRGRTMVREYEDEAARRVSIFIENALPGGEACTDEGERDALERAVSVAASLALDHLERGFAVRLVARGEVLPTQWLIGREQATVLLTALALLPAALPETPFAIRPDSAADPVLVTPRPSAPAAATGRTRDRRGFTGRVVEA